MSQFIPEVGDLVQIWDMLYELDFATYDKGFLIEHHGKIGVVLSNTYLNQDYREIFVAGCSEMYHINNLRRILEANHEEG